MVNIYGSYPIDGYLNAVVRMVWIYGSYPIDGGRPGSAMMTALAAPRSRWWGHRGWSAARRQGPIMRRKVLVVLTTAGLIGLSAQTIGAQVPEGGCRFARGPPKSRASR
jgi:hypothetical protein